MIHTFNKGRINKDVDVRFLDKAEISHSENLRFRGMGEDGVARSIKGNLPISDVADTGMVCNGAVYDSNNDRIFYWITDSNGNDRIVEYNLKTNKTTIKLQGDLNLHKDYKVLTANEINGLLFWVDSGLNNPRQLDLSETLTNFVEDDISVIKMPPFEEPKIKLIKNSEIESNELEERVLYFAYRYRYQNNEYSSFSFYSKPSFYPKGFEWDKFSLNNKGMVNLYNEIEISFNTGSHRVKEVDLVYREANNSTVYRLRKFNKEDEGWGDDEIQTFTFSNNKAIDVIPPEEVNALYYNVPNRPFTQELIFNRLVYGNYYEGFDLKDINGDKINLEYFVEYKSSHLENEIVVSRENNSLELLLDITNLRKNTLYKFDFNIKGELNANSDVNIEDLVPPTYNETFYLLLTRDYDSVSEMVGSNDFIGFLDRVNRSIQKSLDQVANGTITQVPKIYQSMLGNLVRLRIGGFSYNIDITPYESEDNEIEQFFGKMIFDHTVVSDVTMTRLPSAKSNRGYEVCLYYYDKWNRQSSALVSNDNTVFIPHEEAINRNELKVSIAHNPPKDAVKYKIGVKEGRYPYDIIYATEYYEEDEFRYIRLDEENKDKVKVGNKIIPKVDESGFFQLYNPIEVLEVELKQEDFLKESFTSSSDNIKESPGLYMKIKSNGLNISYNKHTLYDEKYEERAWRITPKYKNYEPFTTMKSNAQPTNDYNQALKNKYDIPIPKGSVFELEIKSDKGDLEETTNVRYVASRDYDNFIEWKESVNFDFGEHNDDVFIERLDTKDKYNAFVRVFGMDGYKMYEIYGRIVIGVTSLYSGDKARGGGDRAGLKLRFKLERGVNLLSNSLLVFETLPDINNEEIFYETAETFKIENGYHLGKEQNQTGGQPAIITLDYFNCFTFGNGVESWKIRDRFINTDVSGKSINGKFRGVSILEEEFKELHREADLIYGGKYNDDLKYNGLSAFNPSLGNWKTLDKEQGSVQRVLSRDTDLLIFQTEKTGKVMYGKSVLYDQAGLSVIQQTEDVLGSYIPYSGEFGISYNPESLASWGNNIYHTDRKRGVVMRLSNSGYDKVSDLGMRYYYAETFKPYEGFIMGGYDPKHREYLLGLDGGVWSFYEDEKVFTTQYQYEPEFMLYANNRFFTWKDGVMYEHDINPQHNMFYGKRTESRVVFSFAEGGNDDKVFNALAIHGNQPWQVDLKTNLTETYINLKEFDKKESYFYTYIRKDVSDGSRDLFSLGVVNKVNNSALTISGGSDLVGQGDIVRNESGIKVGTIVSIRGNVLTLNLVSSVNEGDFLVAEKVDRIEGSSMRGYYMQVDMRVLPITPVELFSVESKEFLSKL